MEEERLKAILESMLFAAGEPVSLMRLTAALGTVPREDIRRALGEMALAYADGARGIVLEQVAGGYQLRTPREHAFYVRRLLASKPPRLSRPLLETLAIIAYRQPITRPEIESLRGVDCGAVLETLLERRLVRIAGRKEVPGRPMIYATTSEFLETFGLKDLESLPDLSEFREVEAAEEPVEEQAEGAAAHGREPAQHEDATTPEQPPIQSPTEAASSIPLADEQSATAKPFEAAGSGEPPGPKQD